ncbi:MAG: YciI family protein [Paludibacter sp.]|nr:YciI family protein [Paludibacter sp.]
MNVLLLIIEEPGNRGMLNAHNLVVSGYCRTTYTDSNKYKNMDKQFYVVHLLPLRPDFATTMTVEERAIMMQHIAYWNGILNQGKVYAFGPVIDPKGVYGLGVVTVDNEQELKDIISNDPAGKINKYEYFPMKAVVPKISILANNG